MKLKLSNHHFRELFPRLLLASAFIKLHHFCPDFKDDSSFEDLLFSVRGLGNPILAIYVQMFLLRSYGSLDDINGEKSKLTFNEMLKVLNCLSKERPRTYEKITFEDYIQLYKPAINWISFSLTKTNSDKAIISILKALQTNLTEVFTLIFDCLLSHMSVDFIQTHTQYLVDKCLAVQTPDIVISLGKALLRCQTKFDKKEDIINTFWTVISNFVFIDQYLPCVAVWMEFVAVQFENREVNKLLGVVTKKIATFNQTEYDISRDLVSMLINIIKRRLGNVLATISLQNFISIFALITKENFKYELSKEILEELIKEDIIPSSDTTVHEILTSICDVLADNVNALTSSDEQRQVSILINNAIARCSQLPDHQKQLSFLSELRYPTKYSCQKHHFPFLDLNTHIWMQYRHFW